MNNATAGSGLGTLLTVLFVALKLLGHITWSWWWVLSPLWLSLAVFLAVLIILALLYIIAK